MAIALTRENNFDFLRFVAASLVLFSHSFPLYGVQGEPLARSTGFDTFGGLAVGVFFVISGFLITASWTKNPRLAPYLANRVLRIFPAYITVITLAVVYTGLCITTLPFGEFITHPQTREYFLNLSLYVQRYKLPGAFESNPYGGTINGSIWTLPKEFTMYLMVAALGLTHLLRGRVMLALYAVLFVGYVAYMESSREADAWFHASLTKNAALFLAGAMFWHYRERITLSPCVALILLCALVFSAKTPWARYAFMLILPYFVMFAGLWKVRLIRGFGKYGDFSYGMFLYAFPVQQSYMHWVGDAWGFWPFVGVSWCITLLCAVASWHLVERPCLKLKSRSLRRAG
jgi:peptidoglycan/LPS O-acetylase OafA/YrhL